MSESIDVLPCRCGQSPGKHQIRETAGHGEVVYEYWLECRCGMATRRVSDWCGSALECLQKCADIWNRGMDR